LPGDVVVERRDDHPGLRRLLQDRFLRARQVAAEVAAHVGLPAADGDGERADRPSSRLVVSARSVLRMIALPCVGFRPAPGCRPPGPRRDTPATGGGLAGISLSSVVTF